MLNKKIFWVFILLGYVQLCVAQDAHIDSLKNALNSTPEDTTRVNLLIELSKNYFSTSPPDAIAYGEQAKALAEKLQFKRGLAYSLKNIGMGYYMKAEYVDAINNWQRSLEVFDSIG